MLETKFSVKKLDKQSHKRCHTCTDWSL